MSNEYKEKLIAVACALSAYEFTEGTPCCRIQELRVALLVRGVGEISLFPMFRAAHHAGDPWLFEFAVGGTTQVRGETVHEALNNGVREAACRLVAQVLEVGEVVVEQEKHTWRARVGNSGDIWRNTWHEALRDAALAVLASDA